MTSDAVMSDNRQRLSDSWARSAKIVGYISTSPRQHTKQKSSAQPRCSYLPEGEYLHKLKQLTQHPHRLPHRRIPSIDTLPRRARELKYLAEAEIDRFRVFVVTVRIVGFDSEGVAQRSTGRAERENG